MSKYSKNFLIKYYEGNKYGELTPIYLLNYLSDIAICHSESVNMGLEDLYKDNKAWMIYKWKVSMDKYPKTGEKITIQTWASKFYKFYSYREFSIYDESGNNIGKASSLWLYIDMKRKRPVRIPKEFNEIYKLIPERNFKTFSKLIEDINESSIINFNTRKSDIDTNNHVNNAKYLEWMLETIPSVYDDSYFLSEFEIEYKKEVLYGDKVSSISEKDLNTYNHKILNQEKELKTLGKTKWKERI